MRRDTKEEITGDKITSGTGVHLKVFGEVEACLFGAFRVLEAVAAASFESDFSTRINETIFLRGEGQAFHFLRSEEADGVVHFSFVAFAALGLKLLELAESVLHRTVQR
jgi:hypothetical protein